MAMPKTLTGTYGSAEAARNAHEDLIHTGFPSEKVFLDRDKGEVKVITADGNEREAREILDRHQPTEVGERPL
jgi:hypothetical protein